MRKDHTTTPLRRYTNLASALHILQQKRITLLNPATWDDRNDAYFMAEYKRLKGAETVLALCFTDVAETYHHWRVFSHGPDGVRIEFKREAHLSSLKKEKGIKHGNVEYIKIDDARKSKTIPLEKLPFLKRWPYRQENEYRIIYVDPKEAMQTRVFRIDIDWIDRITLNPWMSESLKDSVSQTLKGIPDCSDLRVYRSTLTENETWKSLASRAKARRNSR